MRTRLPLILLLLALPGLLAGCGRDTPGAPGAATSSTALDQAEVTAVLAGLPEVTEAAQFESEEPTELATAADEPPLPGAPLRFWRVITGVERRLEFAFADPDSAGRPTTAVVTLHRQLTGRFNVLRRVPGAAADSFHLVHKPLADHAVRRVLLKRAPAGDAAGPAWRLVALSGERITARDAATRVLSLRVQSAERDTTITDPLAFFRLRGVLKLEPGAPVTLTVTTPRDDDVVVLCRAGHRLHFRNEGGGVHTAVWRVPDLRPEEARPGRPPLFHVGVNALSHGTLFDDAAAYALHADLLAHRGIGELFERALRSRSFPVEVAEVRTASDPLTATARGAHIAAMFEK